MLACAHPEQVLADDLLVAAGGIPIRHVEEGDAEVESTPQDGNRIVLIEHPALPGGGAHRHRAEAKLRHPEAGLPEPNVIHARPTPPYGLIPRQLGSKRPEPQW